MNSAIEAPLNSIRSGRLFHSLALTTIVAIFALVALGGVVRVTGSGLGCPDWPLCHGRIIPPAEAEVLIEYSHRLVASAVGVLVLAVLVAAWRSYRQERWIFVPAVLGFLILIAQVILGGITVITELPPEIVLAHLATAQALLACMVLIYIVARFGPPNIRPRYVKSSRWSGFPTLALFASLSTFGLLLSGSYVVGSGSETACGQSWPLCLGELAPRAEASVIHMLHRLISLAVGALILFTLWRAWQMRKTHPAIAMSGAIVGAFFFIQIFVGAANIWLGFPLATKVLHLAMATATWGALIAMTVLSYIPDHSGDFSVQQS